MATMSGADLAVEQTTNGTTWTSLGKLRRFSINSQRDMFEATAASDTNKTYKPGKRDFAVTGEFVHDDTALSIYSAAEGTSAVTLRFIPNKTVSGHNWNGTFWVSFSLDAPYDGMVTGSFEARADGAVTRATTTA